MRTLSDLNTATKYPSIPTYHPLGERGILLPEPAVTFTGEVLMTEKVDGTSSRIIRTPEGDWLIGSREGLLTARGDRVANPELGIVAALSGLAERLRFKSSGHIIVLYLETYGADIGRNAAQYTGTGAVGYRLFDLARIPLEVCYWQTERIAAWRDSGNQEFAGEDELHEVAAHAGIELTPRLGCIDAAELPTGLRATHEWLTETIPTTRVALDAGAGNRAEGIVIRNADRAAIAKIRFQNYERTLNPRGSRPQTAKTGT